jgi:Hypoxia induced protein conserved region
MGSKNRPENLRTPEATITANLLRRKRFPGPFQRLDTGAFSLLRVAGEPKLAGKAFKSGNRMETVLHHLTAIAALAVFVVLVLGLFALLRGTSPNRSQMLMRWRIGLQFLAIIIIMLTVYLTGHGH